VKRGDRSLSSQTFRRLKIVMNAVKCSISFDATWRRRVCDCAARHRYRQLESSNEPESWGFHQLGPKVNLAKLSSESSVSVHMQMLVEEFPNQVLCNLLLWLSVYISFASIAAENHLLFVPVASLKNKAWRPKARDPQGSYCFTRDLWHT
jgi:hypothetical protein